MREIKLRVYNKLKKEIENVSGISFENQTIVTTKGNCYILSDCILMQYTGLKDKNGKKIYEGDILKFSEVDTAIVEWNEKYAYFLVKPIQDYDFDSDVLGHTIEYSKVEVIGNIYDNPELLEEKE